MSALRQFDTVDVLFRPRMTHRGCPLKWFLAPLSGAKLRVSVGWLMEDDERYPGEWVLIPADDRSRNLLGETPWIASGDCEVVE